MSHESRPTVVNHWQKAILAGALTVSLTACREAPDAAPPQPTEAIPVAISPAVRLVSDFMSSNRFESCSATKIGPDTYLTARHCFFLNTPYDQKVSRPYDVIAAQLPLPTYHLDNVEGIHILEGLTSAVQNPAGKDVAVFTTTIEAPQLASATVPDKVKLKPHDTLTVTGYPARLDDQSATFEVEYLGNINITSMDGNYVDPEAGQEFQAYVLPDDTPRRIARTFCEGGGMSGAGFIDQAGEVVGVLSTVIETSNKRVWAEASEILGLAYRTQICLAVPVNEALITQYQQAEGFVPPPSKLSVSTK